MIFSPPLSHILNPGIDIVYWINLDRSTERRQFMETQVLSNECFRGIPTVRIPAVDGKNERIDNYITNQKSNGMSSLEYGCTISHLHAIYEFSKTNFPVALILEDDICLDFQPYWKTSIAQLIQDAPLDWDILQLCYIAMETPPVELYESNPSKKNLCSTAAYIIRNQSAKSLMANIRSPIYPYIYQLEPAIPHQADRYLYTVLKTYCYKYPYFIYQTNNDSYIHPTHVDFHTTAKQKVRQMYENICTYQHFSWYLWLFLLLITIIILVWWMKNYSPFLWKKPVYISKNPIFSW